MALFESRAQTLRRVVEEENYKRRDIQDPVSGSEFSRSYRKLPARTLISGGLQRNRLWYLDSRIRLSFRCGYSAVAIICPEELANGYGTPFEARGAAYREPAGPVFFTDGTRAGFDPLLSVSPKNLPSILAHVSGVISPTPAGAGFWQFVLNLLHSAYPRPGLRELLSLDMLQLPGCIQHLANQGQLDPVTASNLSRAYTPALNNDASAAAALCAALTPLTRFLRGSNVGMADLAQKQGLLLLDTLPANSQGALDLIFALLDYTVTNIRPVSLVTDGIGCDQNDILRSRFFSQADTSLPMVLGGDIPAVMAPLFPILSGNNSTKLVLTHDGGGSAAQWSAAFGEYPETVIETSQDQSRSNVAVIERTHGQGISTRVDEHAPRISQADLQNLPRGRAFVRTPDTPSIFTVDFLEMSLEQFKEDLICFVENY